MKLTFKISPQTTGFTEKIINPDYSKLKFKRENNGGKGKFTVNGNIVLTKNDYDFYINTVGGIAYDITAYYKGEVYFICDYKYITETPINKSFNRIELGLTAKTIYVDDGWQNYDVEYNINQITPVNNDLYFMPGFIGLKRYTSTFSSKRLENNSQVNSSLGVSDYDIEYIDDLYSSSVVPPDLFFEYEGTVHYVREQAIGYYINSVAYEPDEDGGWTYIADVTINGITYPEYFRTNGVNTYTFTPLGEPYTLIENANLVYNKPSITYTGVTRKATDVIEWLFNEMGLTSINFDSSGTSTDSFYSFKSMQGESLTYGSTTTDLMYSRLLIMNLTDFIPADDDGQKDMPASITNISLKTILEYFESLDFEWFIEDRSGTYYFVLQHKSDKVLGTTNPDLTNYFNKNRTYLENQITVDPAEYHKIVNEMTCKSIDFVGTDAVFNKVYSTSASKIYTDNKIFTDLNDIANRRADVYSDEDVSNIVIIAAQSDTTVKDYVREAAGVLTTVGVNNSELSFSYLIKNIFGGFPDADYTANGANYTAANSRLKKIEKIEFNLPADNIINNYDFSNTINTFGDESEIESIEQEAYNNICKLTLKK